MGVSVVGLGSGRSKLGSLCGFGVRKAQIGVFVVDLGSGRPKLGSLMDLGSERPKLSSFW